MEVTQQQIAELNSPLLADHEADLAHCSAVIGRRGLGAEPVIGEIARFSVACPAWALGTGGTRFGRFPGPGEPRTTEEKVDDVAALTALTGANRTISLHVPWDDPKDPNALRAYAADRGVAFDAINSNTFQDNSSTTRGGAISYKFGSLAHTSPDVRKVAIEHNLYCIEMGEALGSKALSVWLADGTNHPGQASFRGQFQRVADGLRLLHDHLPEGWKLFVEHKPYEPSFYSSVNNDWGSSLLLAQAAGANTRCLVDFGHHLANCNIEQVVSRLAMTGRLGGFHFNDSKYGDDDLTVGSIKPYQLFLVFCELLEAGGGRMPDLAYLIDESHNLKDPLEDLIQATEATQIALAQALLVDTAALREAQEANDPAGAQEVLHRAYRTDVRPLVAEARLRNRAALEPLGAFRAIGYRARVAEERGHGQAASGL